MMQELGDIDQLENLLRGATNPGALAEVDIDRARDLLGDDAAKSLERMAEMAKMLEDAGLINNKEGHFELTPRAIRRSARTPSTTCSASWPRTRWAATRSSGWARATSATTTPSPTSSATRSTSTSSARCATPSSAAGGHAGATASPEDFEVERTEHLVRSSTVLMLDLSLSMPMRDNFLPAKKVAMALHSLITSQFPRDFMGIVGFSEVARELTAEQLPEVSWDFVYGTNMQHGFALSRQMLARQSGTKQIIMITDGEPTAHILPNGEPFFSYPPVQETVDATLQEVQRCTRDGIRINTFMLDANSYLQTFIERLTEMNKGRAFFTTPENLGDYVLVDFIEQKKQMMRGRGARA
jgi:uncharacterized protein with von Willebrand factor type A (vWA) domain